MSNFKRTADWLKACGKEQHNDEHLSVQIGCHIEEFLELMATLETTLDEDDGKTVSGALNVLEQLGNGLKQGLVRARIQQDQRVNALDALCDGEVTGNGIAYLLDFDKDGADQAVLDSNDSKLREDGTPVILPGGKIGKSLRYQPPALEQFI